MKSLIPWKEYNFMMCQSIGLPPISTIGFGLTRVSSLNLDPTPPARITAFIEKSSFRCTVIRESAMEWSKLQTKLRGMSKGQCKSPPYYLVLLLYTYVLIGLRKRGGCCFRSGS